MHAFIGTDGNRPLDAGQRLVLSGGQGLLDHGHPGGRAGREMLLQIVFGPGLIGIHNQFRVGCSLAHGRRSGPRRRRPRA